MKKYKQCGLKQDNHRTTGWIEERGAKVGLFVEIEELGGFWEVTGVGEISMTAKELANKQQMDRGSLLSIK